MAFKKSGVQELLRGAKVEMSFNRDFNVFFVKFEWIFLANGHILKLLEAADAI